MLRKTTCKMLALFVCVASISAMLSGCFFGSLLNRSLPATDAMVSEKDVQQTIPQAKVTTEVLNVRSGPGTEYEVVGQLKNGDIVSVYEISGDWARTDTGWVSKSYIADLESEEEETHDTPDKPDTPATPDTPSGGNEQTTKPSATIDSSILGTWYSFSEFPGEPGVYCIYTETFSLSGGKGMREHEAFEYVAATKELYPMGGGETSFTYDGTNLSTWTDLPGYETNVHTVNATVSGNTLYVSEFASSEYQKGSLQNALDQIAALNVSQPDDATESEDSTETE